MLKTTPLEKAENSFDFLTRIFGFIENHGVAAALFLFLIFMTTFMLVMWWLERGERISAQEESNRMSADTVSALNNATHAIDGIKESFERLLMARLGGKR